MSSIEAFSARRVRESLRSIGRYLDSATHLAEGIPPGETVRLDLEAPGPRLRSLHEKTGTRKIKLPESSASGDTITLIGEGENLDGPKALTLVRVARHAASITTNSFQNKESESFEATFEVKALSPGVYDARFENEAGGHTLLSRAVHIESSHDDYKGGPPAEGSTSSGKPRAQAK